MDSNADVTIVEFRMASRSVWPLENNASEASKSVTVRLSVTVTVLFPVALSPEPLRCAYPKGQAVVLGKCGWS
jgi:hypothetical protein